MNGKESLLSFLCVSYNHENYIESCIRSIWNNDYRNIEIIVLDDGSKDNSVGILNKLKEQSPFPMTIIAQENTGCIGANFNKLINLSKGEYFSVISCDDMVIENTINEKMEEFKKNSNLAYICHSKIVGVDKNGKIINTVPPMKLDDIINPTSEDILNLDYEEIGSYYIQGAIYKKSVALAFEYFDEDMICDDIIFRTKLSKYMLQHKDLEFKVLHKPAVYYRRHGDNISNNGMRQVRGVLQYYERYWSDRNPPKNFFKLFDFAVVTKKDLVDLLIKEKYKATVFNNIPPKVLNRILFEEDYLYKKQGIPCIFQILKYKKDSKKIKVIKLFNIKILEYSKELR